MTIGTLITIGVIIFTAGGSYALISNQLKVNTDSISRLKIYIEQQLTKQSLRIDELQRMVQRHAELFRLMGFNSENDVKTFMRDRK